MVRHLEALGSELTEIAAVVSLTQDASLRGPLFECASEVGEQALREMGATTGNALVLAAWLVHTAARVAKEGLARQKESAS
jgi:hypothetical protein